MKCLHCLMLGLTAACLIIAVQPRAETSKLAYADTPELPDVDAEPCPANDTDIDSRFGGQEVSDVDMVEDMLTTQELVTKCRPAIVVVAIGEYDATGFLIATEPPLVATVAHAAVLAEKPENIIIRLNETGTVVPVQAIHLHPDYRKQATAKEPYSADIALLELTPAPDLVLGQPLQLAMLHYDRDLRGLEVLSLGFPTYTTLTGERESAESSIQHGVIQRLLDFDGTTTSQPPAKRPLFEHSFVTSPGESGAPVIDRDTGRVVGIHHGTRRMYRKNTKELFAEVSVALRVDLLWQLLEKTNFSGAVAKSAP